MRNYPEHDLQRECVKWFDLQYPNLKQLFFHIPTERKTTPQAGARLRSIGQRAGVADCFLAIPKNPEYEGTTGNYVDIFYGFFIEFKAPKGKQTPEQKNFQIEVEQQGYLYVLINSFDRFKEVIEQYLS